mgnify:CR=1 FL=1
MGQILWLIIGGLAGWIAGNVMRGGGFVNMIFGILMVALASQVKKLPSQESSPVET